MVSKSCVKYASMLQIFWFSILLGNYSLAHFIAHFCPNFIRCMHFLKMILLKGKLIGITFDDGRVTVMRTIRSIPTNYRKLHIVIRLMSISTIYFELSIQRMAIL